MALSGTGPRLAGQEAFDRLFAEGQAAVSAGAHRVQEPPIDGGFRWGLSALLRPDVSSAEVLSKVADEASNVAGGGHWVTGSAASSHLTLRALETFREDLNEGDPAVKRYVAALAAAAAGAGPLMFTVTGVTLTPHSIMACALPLDDGADRLAAAFARALGSDGSYEGEFTRDFWYMNLVHFGGTIPEPARLIDWVAARRDQEIATVVVDEVQLVRWRFTGNGMVPIPVSAVPLA